MGCPGALHKRHKAGSGLNTREDFSDCRSRELLYNLECALLSLKGLEASYKIK